MTRPSCILDAFSATLCRWLGAGEGRVGMAEQAARGEELAGSARLVLVQGAALLRIEPFTRLTPRQTASVTEEGVRLLGFARWGCCG